MNILNYKTRFKFTELSNAAKIVAANTYMDGFNEDRELDDHLSYDDSFSSCIDIDDEVYYYKDGSDCPEDEDEAESFTDDDEYDGIHGKDN